MEVREYSNNDMKEIIRIWNEVVEEGIAFPQEELLAMESGTEFFASQTYTGVAEEDGKIYSTSFIQTMSVDVDIYAMPAMPYHRMLEENILENNSLRIAFRRAKSLASEFFSSMPLWRVILMQDICMNVWVLRNWGPFPEASG